MQTVRGHLTAAGNKVFAGYGVTAAFSQRAVFDDGAPDKDPDQNPPERFFPATRVATVAPDGTFSFPLPDDGDWQEPLVLTATGPSGAVAGTRPVKPGEIGDDLELPVTAAVPVPVDESTDPTLGQVVRLTGRLLDSEGAGARAGVLVVIWAVAPGGDDSDAYPALVAETTASGYFFEMWPPEVMKQAYATVAGGAQMPIPLDADNRLPRTVVLVAEVLPPPEDHDDGDCSCTTAPPVAPSAADLAADPDTFAADKGGCVDMTVPNRALEEVEFHAVVRTTQPEIKGVTLPGANPVPPPIIRRLAELALLGDDLAGVPGQVFKPVEVVETTGRLRSRLAAGREISLHPTALAEITRDTETLSSAKLLAAEQVSLVRDVRDAVTVLTAPSPGRVTLDADHAVDWDDTPTTYQATTIAHGHLLTLKQVWAAAGFSLGDPLYSLPLAPGQQKLVAVVDWDRQEDAIREASRRETELVTADLVHDRDISEVINTSLHETMRGRSRADTESVAAGIAGFIGPVVFGAAGGVSSAGSSASQSSSRDVAGTMLNQARDRTLQAASSVRSQRSTVVQSAGQGESLRAQTEAVANHNHCHAVTVEYFEVLRHFQVSQQLAHVQECLFVPLELTPFTSDKAIRHRDALYRALRRRDLKPAFDALERVRTNWVDADFPLARYADEAMTELDGDLWLTISLPRPADTEEGDFDSAQWTSYAPYLAEDTEDTWTAYMGTVLPEQRDAVWDTRLAPRIAERLVSDTLRVELVPPGGGPATVLDLDATLVTPFVQDQPLLVSLRPEATLPAVVRANVERVRLSMVGVVPVDARILMRSAAMHYRTAHLHHSLFVDYRVDNDLGVAGEIVEILTGLDMTERRDPRREDLQLAARIVAHLNEHVEYYHQAIWLAMDPNRRYLLLDGFVAPNADGRSVASVVENRLIGVVGNCLVMPVVPGLHLDPSYELDPRTDAQLIDLYATDPAPPMRISVPTRGVFADAVMGACNSCEVKDDTRLWRWDESPIPDEPTPIEQVSTDSRRSTPPNLAPDEFPGPLVGFQDVPEASAFGGLAAAMSLIGTPNLFRDITGLALNQENASQALQKSLAAAQGFASQAGALAQQRHLGSELDRTLQRVKSARDGGLITPDQARTLTDSAIRGAIGEPRSTPARPTESGAMQRALQKAAESPNSSVKVEGGGTSLEVNKGSAAGGAVDVDIDPSISPVQQPSTMTCWAAVGAMMLSWRERASLSIEAALDSLGGDWRAKFDANAGLTPGEVTGFMTGLGLTVEPPISYLPAGIAGLLARFGPLWVVNDNDVVGDRITHARIVTGIHGDGSPDGTLVTIADPATGTSGTETFARFSDLLDASDTVDFATGIAHF